jgi:hypothetical protein
MLDGVFNSLGRVEVGFDRGRKLVPDHRSFQKTARDDSLIVI